MLTFSELNEMFWLSVDALFTLGAYAVAFLLFLLVIGGPILWIMLKVERKIRRRRSRKDKANYTAYIRETLKIQ